MDVYCKRLTLGKDQKHVKFYYFTVGALGDGQISIENKGLKRLEILAEYILTALAVRKLI